MLPENRRNYLLIGSLILMFLVLSPVLESGFINDDALTSLTPGILLEEHTNIISHSLSQISGWLLGEGRLFPLAFFYMNSIFLLYPGTIVYKLFLILMILINSILFYYLIRLISESDILAIFSFLILPVFLKVTGSQNSILSYNALIQLTFILFLLSLIALIYYLKTKGRWWLLASLFLYGICLLTYEISYPFFLISILIIFSVGKERQWKENVKLAAYFSLGPVICIVSAKLLRSYFFGFPFLSGSTGIYSVNPDIRLFIVSLAKEISGTIPLSYVLLDPHKIFGADFTVITSETLPTLLFVGVGTFFLFFKISEIMLDQMKKEVLVFSNRLTLLLLGIGFTILPLVPISITFRHQEESRWGYYYLPGYISSFGACIVAICLIYLLYKKLSALETKKITCLLGLFSVIFSVFSVITVSSNAYVVNHANEDWLYPRQIVEEGIRNGIFSDIPNNSILFVDKYRTWDTPTFYRMQSGIHFSYIGSPHTPVYSGPYVSKKILPANSSECSDTYCHYAFSGSTESYYLRYFSDSKTEGTVILGKINDIFVTNESILGGTTDKIKIFIKSSQINELNSSFQVVVSGRWADDSEDPPSKIFLLKEKDLTLVSKGDGWKIFSFDSRGKHIDLLSLMVSMGPREDSQLIQTGNSDSFFQNPKTQNFTGSSPADMNTALQIKYKDGFFGNGVCYKPITVQSNFSIQLLARPSAAIQAPYAVIVGNHPGINYFEGFVIQQDNLHQNDYVFVLGNGKSWNKGVKFHLTQGTWNYLAIIVEDGRIFTYENGNLMDSTTSADIMKNSDMPVCVGNWKQSDRPFKGSIKEILISNSSITSDVIRSNWKFIQNLSVI